jgi:UDP-glucose 4-epimerase
VLRKNLKRVFIAGGAGFVGSHFVDRLLGSDDLEAVTVFDNFSSGSRDFLKHHRDNKKLSIRQGDIRSKEDLSQAMTGHDTVIHLASNPDIARAIREPSIDFDQGTLLTHHIVEAARTNKVAKILYASGSGVYGERGQGELKEDDGRLWPISTYGASKLAGESMICAYSHMFGITGIAFRFANVVGKRQTHGVVLDFIKKLKQDPSKLDILGDGTQSKSYIHISDVISAVLLASGAASESATESVKDPFQVFNVSTPDFISVHEIAEMTAERVVGARDKVKFVFAGGDRGWKGDIPVVRLNADKIRALGWQCKNNTRQAIELSIAENLEQI